MAPTRTLASIAMRATVAVAAFIGLTVAAPAPAGAVTCPSVQGGTPVPGPTPGVNWSGCNLTGAYLVNANLAEANLSGANLTDATFGIANLTDANLSGANLRNAIFYAARAYRANFTNADLQLATFQFAGLNSASFSGANLLWTDFTGATLWGVRSGGVRNVPRFLPTDWQVTSGYLVGPWADLSGANLRGAALVRAHLENALLVEADLAGASLTGASVSGASFLGANLDDVRSGYVVGTPATLPERWSVTKGYFIGPGAYLADAYLTGVDLRSRDLSGANLQRARLNLGVLTLANLNAANLSSANLSGTALNRPTAVGTLWTNTICPDGLSSALHSGTCLGVQPTVPSVVRSVKVTHPTATSARLTWLEPASTSGVPVTYEYCRITCGFAASWATADTPLLLTGLTRGLSYTVRIRASNKFGDGPITLKTWTQPS